MSDISRKMSDKAECWNDRLRQCVKEKNLTQNTFAKAYKEKYGTGTQTDISRWMRVGSIIRNKKTKKETQIGFPSFETMVRIANFFGVSVGYLTGETDYHTFEMEQTCSYLGISEEAGTSIQRIVAGDRQLPLSAFLEPERRAALCYLLTATAFADFIEELCCLAEALYNQKNPINYMECASKEISPELLEHALEHLQDGFLLWPEEFPDTTPEMIEAVKKLNAAQDKGFDQEMRLPEKVKVERYDLYEKYVRLVDEVVCDDHLQSMTERRLRKFNSIGELKNMILNACEQDNICKDKL